MTGRQPGPFQSLDHATLRHLGLLLHAQLIHHTVKSRLLLLTPPPGTDLIQLVIDISSNSRTTPARVRDLWVRYPRGFLPKHLRLAPKALPMTSVGC
jgi:hypothetical protein